MGKRCFRPGPNQSAIIDVRPGGDDTIDSDSDGIPDDCDVCQGGDDTVDSDGDSVPDDCDVCPNDNPDDSAGDGVCDSDDVCPGGDDALDDDGDGVRDCFAKLQYQFMGRSGSTWLDPTRPTSGISAKVEFRPGENVRRCYEQAHWGPVRRQLCGPIAESGTTGVVNPWRTWASASADWMTFRGAKPDLLVFYTLCIVCVRFVCAAVDQLVSRVGALPRS